MSWNSERREITYDSRSLRINGKPFFCLSGAVHYVRSHPSAWPQIFRCMRRDGLNTVETYVFWGDHELEPPEMPDAEPRADFSGPRDLVRFLRCAKLHGLNAILRLGPYVCAEVNYGGFPWWLRQVCEKGSSKPVRFRTWDPAYCAQVERWLKYLVDHVLKPARVFAPQGGPVILAQIENEYAMIAESYGPDGQQYLDWIASLANQLALGVPLVMCYGASQRESGRVIETINAFYAHEHVESLRRAQGANPQPLLWTECWTGWYDVWGAPHHRRDAADLAYAVLRFLAAGGAGINYYMYFGGTNWRRENTMYLQATSYDYDAPLNEYVMETTKSRHLRRLHESIQPFLSDRDGVLDMSRLELKVFEGERRAILYERSTVSGDADHRSEESVRCVFDSADIRVHLAPELREIIVNAASRDTGQDLRWRMLPEPPPLRAALSDTSATLATIPDLVDATAGTSDYAWYILRCPTAQGSGLLQLEVADFGRVWRRKAVDQGDDAERQPLEWAAAGPEPPVEDRFPNAWNSTEYGYGIVEVGAIDCHEEYVVLVSSLGMVKGDWQLPPGYGMARERKGLLRASYRSDVTLADDEWRDALVVGFAAGLRGERIRSVIEGDADAYPYLWTPQKAALSGRRFSWPRWYRASLAIPPPNADETEGIILDLYESGVEKGWIYMNGEPCGRHWRVHGTMPKNGFLRQGDQEAPIEQVGHGQPTQRYFYIPPWHLHAKGRPSTLVIFDEHANGEYREFEPHRLRVYRAVLRVVESTPTSDNESKSEAFIV
jgi:beta-galactosidase